MRPSWIDLSGSIEGGQRTAVRDSRRSGPPKANRGAAWVCGPSRLARGSDADCYVCPGRKELWQYRQERRAAKALLAVVGVSSGPSEAAGCVKGAVVGGIAGHFVGHHGLLGAGVGCAIGHHEANRRERAWNDRYDRGYGRRDYDRGYTTGYGSSVDRSYGYQR